jgi:hypothetical protein
MYVQKKPNCQEKSLCIVDRRWGLRAWAGRHDLARHGRIRMREIVLFLDKAGPC